MASTERVVGKDSIFIQKFDGPVPKEVYRSPTKNKVLSLKERKPRVQQVIYINEQ